MVKPNGAHEPSRDVIHFERTGTFRRDLYVTFAEIRSLDPTAFAFILSMQRGKCSVCCDSISIEDVCWEVVMLVLVSLPSSF
jgi:hypothetical protein